MNLGFGLAVAYCKCMDRPFEPFALAIYRRFLGGESVRDLAEALAIPEDRIEQRLRAAELYHERQQIRNGLEALGMSLRSVV